MCTPSPSPPPVTPAPAGVHDFDDQKASPSHTTNHLDLMRLVFAAMVILSHSSELVDGDRAHEPLTRISHTISFGELGVDGFFILSGYMIAASWERDPNIWSYLRKRLLRIYPAFITAYLLSTLLVGPIGAANPALYFAELQPIQLLWRLLSLGYPLTPRTFPGSAYAIVNGSLWTIRYEFICYLLVLALGRAGLLASPRVTVALWALAFAAFVAFRAHDNSGETGAIMSSHVAKALRLVPMFLAGLAIYKTGLWKHRAKPLIAAAALLLIAGLTDRVTAEPAVGTAGAYLLFIIGFTPIRQPRLRPLPDISYGVYLYGWPVQKLAIFFWPAASSMQVFMLSLTGAAALGFASWFAVEKPALAFKQANGDGRNNVFNRPRLPSSTPLAGADRS